MLTPPILGPQSYFAFNFLKHESLHYSTGVNLLVLPATAKTYGPEERLIGAKELMRHRSTKDGVWVAIDGEVWDVTQFLERHAVGPKPLLTHSGSDISSVFHKLHPRPDTLERVEPFLTRVGRFDSEELA
ncbi:L-mandelate dehydrogenase [Pseudohyphozyma bogoriensis]|nr:L-mandelate dehydrogenase [Pseudohyphozyma bogoriensis]